MSKLIPIPNNYHLQVGDKLVSNYDGYTFDIAVVLKCSDTDMGHYCYFKAKHVTPKTVTTLVFKADIWHNEYKYIPAISIKDIIK